jgi:heme-degrading monooxygenase HmoA
VIIQIVRFRSGLPDEKVVENYKARAPQYREVEGLVQKYYLRYPDTGEVGAVYVWESSEAIRAFHESELGRSIGDTYQVQGEKVLENAEVLLVLHPS